jgi:hypothetical protein
MGVLVVATSGRRVGAVVWEVAERVLSLAPRAADPRAISIQPVEARHAAWIRNLARPGPAPPRSTRR